MRPKIRQPEPPATEKAQAAEVLQLAWRPDSLEHVIGQDAVVRSLQKAITSKRVPHAYLFTGPSGVGKTTLARIVATMVGCGHGNIIEMVASLNSGVDEARSLVSRVQYQAFGASPVRFVIVDEAHRLSGAAWDALLTPIEEPPAHLFWALCTTEPTKVPVSIKTRCHSYDLKPIAWDTIAEHLVKIALADDMPVNEEIIETMAKKADGSMRQAIVYLSMVQGAQSAAEALRMIEAEEDSKEDVLLARELCGFKGHPGWTACQALVAEMKDNGRNPESMRILVSRYVAGVLFNEKAVGRKTAHFLNVLEAFSYPFTTSDGWAPMLLAVGRICMSSRE